MADSALSHGLTKAKTTTAAHRPRRDPMRWVVLAIAGVAAVLLFRARWSVLRTLAVCAVLGLAAGLAGLPL